MALNKYLRHCDSGVLGRALLVAAVVGPTLVFVNQGPGVLQGAAVDLGRLTLTVLVPFLVASFSGMVARSRAALASAKRELRLERDVQAVSALVRGMQETGSRIQASALAVESSLARLTVAGGHILSTSERELGVAHSAASVFEATVEHARMAHEVLDRLHRLVDRNSIEEEGVECLEEDS